MGAERVNKKDGDGKYTHNRQDVELCRGYQTGKCTHTVGSDGCGRDPKLAHQCSICLSPGHGAHRCKTVIKYDKDDQGAGNPWKRGGGGGGRGRGIKRVRGR